MLILRYPWKRGPAARETGPVFVSATRFTYRRLRDLPAVNLHAWRLRRAWGSRAGAVGLMAGGRPHRRTTYTVSVWRSDEDLRGFLRSPEHAKLVRGFRPRLEGSRSVTWTTDELEPRAAWREGLRRLAGLP